MLAGWGDTVPFPHPGRPGHYPDRLQELQVTAIDDTTCAKQWRRTGYEDSSVWPLFLCTTAGRFGYSDSGSPLFATVNGAFVQVSLVSGGFVDKDKKYKNNKHKNNKRPMKNIPDYGPQLSAPASAGFIAAAIGG